MPLPTAFALVAALAGPTADDLSWMSGYWLSCDGGREVSEAWSDPRAGMMVGHGVTVSGGRAQFETFRVAAHGDGVAYFAQPSGAPPTIFAAVEVEANRVVFENAENDFPQRVIYSRDGEALTARIEGEMNGQTQAMEWRFQKAEFNARCPT